MSWHSFLIPKLDRRLIAPSILLTLACGLIGGIYGAAHDLFTYRLSPEYFTKLKFEQFAWADPGLPDRWHAVEIGFIAGWAVGILTGWFLGRVTLPQWPLRRAARLVLSGAFVVFSCAFTGAIAGYLVGLNPTIDLSHWSELCDFLGVVDKRAFVRVAYIHNGSYLGGAIALIALLVRAARRRKRPHA